MRTLFVTMRDGVRLATDVYGTTDCPTPTIVIRTPYGRAKPSLVPTLRRLAARGYVVLSQDCRGTGESEPDCWDYYVFEEQDGYDCVQWTCEQSWYDGFIGSAGGSYLGQTQWGMATHAAMRAVIPQVSGLGVAVNTARLHMHIGAYAASVGKGRAGQGLAHGAVEHDTRQATLAGGFFDEPMALFPPEVLAGYPDLAEMPFPDAQRALFIRYARMAPAERAQFIRRWRGGQGVTIADIEALSALFGVSVGHDAHSLPRSDHDALAKAIHGAALMVTSWYDWSLNDALATWALLGRAARPETRDALRLIIAPSAHNQPGYHEGAECHPELRHNHNVLRNTSLIDAWNRRVMEGRLSDWPRVTYYLMGANRWQSCSHWPPQEARPVAFHLDAGGRLSSGGPPAKPGSDTYVYDPADPTPTIGGSINSTLYRPGSCDVAPAQARADILSYTSDPLAEALDLVGPLRATIHLSSSAPDSDFCVRLSDVFPDGRALQIQSGLLRTRFRDPAAPQPLAPGRAHELEIDMWATANRFAAGHRIRIDISSADFPRFDRNTNLGGLPGAPVKAVQRIFHGRRRPSRFEAYALPAEGRG